MSISDTMRNDYIAVYTAEIEVDPAKTCLVIVDLMYATGSRHAGLGRLLADQGRLHEAEYRFNRIEQYVVPNSRRLLEYCRKRDIRRVFITYGSEVSDYSDLPHLIRGVSTATNNAVGEREHEILDELTPLPEERIFNKITASAFASTPIELVLHTYGVDTLLFVGVSTNMCVEHTMRDASDRGFRCILIEDACGADSQAMHEAAVTVLQRLYGVAMSTDEIIDQLETKGGRLVVRSGVG